MSHTVPVSCPQKSKSKAADKNEQPWAYQPGAYPRLDAAIDAHAAAYGTIWSPHLLGPDFISFGEFIRRPEVIALCPVGSDARLALEELQVLACFGGSRDESKRALTAHIRESALFEKRGKYRYVQSIFNSIWRNYDGLLAAKKANRRALNSATNSDLRADERKAKDAARKAAARSEDPRVELKAFATQAQRLFAGAAVLRGRAERKECKARKWLNEVDALRGAAAAMELRAANTERKANQSLQHSASNVGASHG